MKVVQLLSGLVLNFVILLLVVGCANSWTGGIPAAYDHAEHFPIVAAVHGISDYEVSKDSKSLVENYVPTNEITLDTNTVHGWVIQFQPVQKDMAVEEYYILPKAARWNCETNSQKVSRDETTCRTVLNIPKNSQFASHDWGMFSDDPVGEYEMVVFIDHKYAADFKFRVCAPRESGD